MDQDGTWHGGGPRSRPHCATWGPSSPTKRGVKPPIFGPCLLWPHDWMDQDGTWHGGGPRSRPHCARWGPSCPCERGTLFGRYLLWSRSPISATAELLCYLQCKQRKQSFIHIVAVALFLYTTSTPAVFRHDVGQAPLNVCYRDITFLVR